MSFIRLRNNDMTNKIDDYLNDYLFDEYGLSDSFKSNGDIENQFS